MDNAVALVQTYLRINGYFTVAEYPVIEAMRKGAYRVATDIDIMAVRFPGVRRMTGARKGGGKAGGGDAMVPDPELNCPVDRPDMLIGEVKEGRAALNSGTRKVDVLALALSRFGCCAPDSAREVAGNLLANGHTTTHSGHAARIVLFGSTIDDPSESRFQRIALGHIVQFLRGYLRANWAVLHHAQFKDPCLGFLMTLEKAAAGER
jgi:hypothetical protein